MEPGPFFHNKVMARILEESASLWMPALNGLSTGRLFWRLALLSYLVVTVLAAHLMTSGMDSQYQIFWFILGDSANLDLFQTFGRGSLVKKFKLWGAPCPVLLGCAPGGAGDLANCRGKGHREPHPGAAQSPQVYHQKARSGTGVERHSKETDRRNCMPDTPGAVGLAGSHQT